MKTDKSAANRQLQIGVLLANSQTEHPKEIISGIFDAIQEENVKITFFLGAQGRALDFWDDSISETSLAYNYQYNSLYDYTLIADMDALIIGYGTLCIYLNEYEKTTFLSKFKNIPYILLEKQEDENGHSFIMSDNYKSMYSIAEHLIEVHGYKKIIHVSGPRYSIEGKLRKQAYIDAMKNHGLTVTDSMIAEGDFTPNVIPIIEELLDNNPDAEAIICANDETAFAAYKVCAKRGIVVGRDIAITGYDDVDTASKLDPPLTTANQDGVDMGYRAVKAAVEVVTHNVNLSSELVPAPLIVRGSCGCDYLANRNDTKIYDSFSQIRSLNDKEIIDRTTSYILDAVKRKKNMPESMSGSFVESCDSLIRLLIKIRENQFTIDDRQHLDKSTLDALRSLIGNSYEEFTQYLSISRFMNYIRMLITYEVTNEPDIQKTKILNNLNNVISGYMESLIMQQNTEAVGSLLENNWAIPSGIQSMMVRSDDSRNLYRKAMNLVKDNGIQNAFLYLNEEPLTVNKDNPISCPKSMRLAAQLIEGKIDTYELSTAPMISRDYGFSNLYPDIDSEKQYSAFLLFQERKQFGILVCEIDISTINMIFGVALQISTALAFVHLHKQEEIAQKKLLDAWHELEEKNKVLSFISSNDSLTNLYNRRGFMEKVFSMLHSEEGKKAYLFFFDLDHLKEINDVFGHAEGDFAIVNAAKFLSELFEENGFCARLGGDEFVGIIANDNSNPLIADDLLDRLHDIEETFNIACQKPYYIEFSAGYTSFVFNKALDIDAVLKNADNVLYEAKKMRKESIRKQ